MRLSFCNLRSSTLSLVVAAFGVTSGYAQSIHLSGKVFDARTSEPLAFASLSVFGTPVGTVTNILGEFDFTITEQFANDSLIISHVGYKSFRDKISDLSKRKLSVGLKAVPVLLEEVVIREKNLTAKEIVAMAVKSLTLNYATQPFCLQGFFREIEEENGKYVLLTEAAVDVYDKNFDGNPKGNLQEAVVVNEMRRSLRYSDRHSRDNIGWALADLVENNDVRYNRGMLDTTNNTFSLDTIVKYNDRLVYGISMTRQTDRGMLYIDMETFGFLKINMERKSVNEDRKYYEERNISKGRKQCRVWFRFSVEFELYQNKLYPRRMHESELNEIIDRASGDVKTVSTETLEFVVMNIIPDKKNEHAIQLKYGMTIKTGTYHEDFWKNYNTLKLTPLDERLIQDLEKEISLQEQFRTQK